MKLWLDDTRPAPDGWLWVKTAPEAITQLKLKANIFDEVSLDHDLGPMEAGTGYDVAVFIEKGAFDKTLAPFKWTIHSGNPVGAYRMETALYGADRYWRNYGS